MPDEIVEWGTLDMLTQIVTSCPDEWSARQLLAITSSGRYRVMRRVCKGSAVSRWEVPAPPETVESLREQVDVEHAAWLSAENALHEANESVESLRAERDAALADVAYWQEQHLIVCDEAVGYKTRIARLRATHTEAEAAWEWSKPKLFPTSWQGENTAQPEGVDKVRDTKGREWERVGSEWRRKEMRKSWRHLIQEQGTVTEVLP